MHNARFPASHMMPSVGALMDPTYLRDAVADAGGRAHANGSSRRSITEVMAFAWRSMSTLLARVAGSR